jgi:hypothetical protein
MIKILKTCFMAAALCLPLATAQAETIRGKVTDVAGEPMEGVMVSAFDSVHNKSISVFTKANGIYAIENLRSVTWHVRARLLGQLDQWQKDVGANATVSFSMKPATGNALEKQRTADSGFGMLKWENKRDRANYKMMCTYCHQVGSRGWRTPERPVDWQTMITRMDGFGGLYKHTQRTLVKRLVATYSPEAASAFATAMRAACASRASRSDSLRSCRKTAIS